VADPDAEAAATAAEVGPAEEFSFNFSDAKKGNQWQPSDVEAALAYYAGEKSQALLHSSALHLAPGGWQQ
jgi:hypothetical protein